MAFDTSKQKVIKEAGVYKEIGKLSFDGAGLTIEVPTKMRTKIVSGFGITQDGTGVSQDAVITDGCVTFTRPSGGTSGAYFNYILFGY
jgi:hypothetical protein